MRADPPKQDPQPQPDPNEDPDLKIIQTIIEDPDSGSVIQLPNTPFPSVPVTPDPDK